MFLACSRHGPGTGGRFLQDSTTAPSPPPKRPLLFVTYWPFGHLQRVHLSKDVGGIPAAAARSGRDAVLLTGVADANLPPLSYRVVATGQTRRLSFSANARECLWAGPLLLQLAPSECLIYSTGPLIPFLVCALRLAGKLRPRSSPGTRFILKMDWDGSWDVIAHGPGLFRGYLNLCAVAFHEIVVENTCANGRPRSDVARLAKPPVRLRLGRRGLPSERDPDCSRPPR